MHQVYIQHILQDIRMRVVNAEFDGERAVERQSRNGQTCIAAQKN